MTYVGNMEYYQKQLSKRDEEISELKRQRWNETQEYCKNMNTFVKAFIKQAKGYNLSSEEKTSKSIKKHIKNLEIMLQHQEIFLKNFSSMKQEVEKLTLENLILRKTLNLEEVKTEGEVKTDLKELKEEELKEGLKEEEVKTTISDPEINEVPHYEEILSNNSSEDLSGSGKNWSNEFIENAYGSQEEFADIILKNNLILREIRDQLLPKKRAPTFTVRRVSMDGGKTKREPNFPRGKKKRRTQRY